METYKSTVDFKVALRAVPKSQYKKKPLIIVSGFFPNPRSADDTKILETSASVENIVNASFHPAQVHGIQLAARKTKDVSWYEGLVYIVDGLKTIGEVQMTVQEYAGSFEHLAFSVELYLPMGTFSAQSRSAITALWPMIHRLKYVEPSAPKMKNDPHNFQAGGCVMLNGKGGSFVALGAPALEKAGLYLPLKRKGLAASNGMLVD